MAPRRLIGTVCGACLRGAHEYCLRESVGYDPVRDEYLIADCTCLDCGGTQGPDDR